MHGMKESSLPVICWFIKEVLPLKRQHGIWNRIAGTADLETEPVPMAPLVELAGDRRIIVENHCGVVAYTQQQIQIRVKYGQVCVEGDQLEMAQMTKDHLVITGRIDRIGIIRRNC